MDKKYLQMSKRYREKGEKREIISIGITAYANLIAYLESSRKYNQEHLADDTENDPILKELAEHNVLMLDKYIGMLIDEAELAETKGRVYIPFFEGFEKELFLHVVCGSDGKGGVII